MSDDDLIRRGDVLPALVRAGLGGSWCMTVINSIPARGVKPPLSIRDWIAPDHDYRPSMDPDDQGDCVECGNSASWHNPPAAQPGADVAAQAREAALREALDAVDNERLTDKTGEPDDEAYNSAIDDAHDAILALIGEPR